ncbi:MAG: response regulator transcription factor [Myxococcales bacterium]|nr:response regulator transcription factor [Myxococcales bacterium]
MASRHILVVDDEARIREVVQYALEQAGHRVTTAADGARAATVLEQRDVDLVVLDVMLPDTDGLELCTRIRAAGNGTPILFLSAKGGEIDRVVGLEVGGDDYLTKPFSPRELVARVKAVLRRGQARAEADPPPEAVLRAGRVSLDEARHEARCDAHLIELTATEFEVLAALLRRPGIVLSRAQLVEQAYGGATHVTERTVDTHVRRIRAKFRAHGATPIQTVHGVGYKVAEA